MILNVQVQLSHFEQALAVRLPPLVARSRVARVLRELYATKSACGVLSCLRALYPEEVENALILLHEKDASSLQAPPLLAAPLQVAAVHRRLWKIRTRAGTSFRLTANAFELKTAPVVQRKTPEN
jgi:hypothetical protein